MTPVTVFWIRAIGISFLFGIICSLIEWWRVQNGRRRYVIIILREIGERIIDSYDLYNNLTQVDGLPFTEEEYFEITADLVQAGLMNREYYDAHRPIIWKNRKVMPCEFVLTHHGKAFLKNYRTKAGKRIFESIPFTK